MTIETLRVDRADRITGSAAFVKLPVDSELDVGLDEQATLEQL